MKALEVLSELLREWILGEMFKNGVAGGVGWETNVRWSLTHIKVVFNKQASYHGIITTFLIFFSHM